MGSVEVDDVAMLSISQRASNERSELVTTSVRCYCLASLIVAFRTLLSQRLA